ncbi:MAG TPA: hypothetical protein VMX74_16050 [Pirellulales bacterium]|nr:hypothetical protein [Pirellulales bacterium]
MSVSVSYESKVNTVETITTSVPAISSANNSVTHDGYNTSDRLTATTTPPATKCAYMLKALSGGAATIDLTDLIGANGVTVDGTGLKVQVMKFKASTGNANAITVTFGASNPYALKGASFAFDLKAGQEDTFYANDATPDISALACEIDLSGTGSQSLQVSIVMG